MTYEEYKLEFLGIENEEEKLGKVASGESATTNLISAAVTSTGKIGGGTNAADYTEFTLAFPTIKFPGSYAFTVVMWNGVSE